ncbi:hypothetical protein, partial [Pseudalkalibacillus caeni]|uniref:hypothetical protein n=1 Tax=Exobacillus caeni TaxID=2574798 RepID=UPI0010FD4737
MRITITKSNAKKIAVSISDFVMLMAKNDKEKLINKVGKPLSRLPPYQTVRALLRHTAYPYVTMS